MKSADNLFDKYRMRPHPLPEAFEVNHRLSRHIAGEEAAAAFGRGSAA